METTATELWQRVLEGDQKAESELYASLTKRLFGLIRKIFPMVSNAEVPDLVQETLIRFFKTYRAEKGEIEPYLFRIARNESVNFLRKQSRTSNQPLPEDGVEDPIANSPLDNLIDAENLQNLHNCVEQLNGEERQVLDDRFFARLTSSEIGKSIGRTDTAVRSLIVRTISKLRRCMGSKGSF